jgi:hypothetical protein
MHNHAHIASTTTQQTTPKPIPAQSGIPLHQDVHHNTPTQWDIDGPHSTMAPRTPSWCHDIPTKILLQTQKNKKLFEGVEVTVGKTDEGTTAIEGEPFANGSGWKKRLTR